MMNILLAFAFLLKCHALRRVTSKIPSCDPLNNMYVINLEGPRGERRRNLMMEELTLHNFSATWYPAADKTTLDHWYRDEERMAGKRVRQTARLQNTPLSSFEIALSKSHKNIYQEIQKKGLSCALILEDDINFACDAKGRLQRFVMSNEMPTDFHLIKLDHCSPKIPDSSTAELKSVRGARGPCASAYIVSQEGAKLLEAGNTPIWMNADGNMDPNHLKHTEARQYLPLKDFTVKPQIAYQANEHVPGGRTFYKDRSVKCGQNHH